MILLFVLRTLDGKQLSATSLTYYQKKYGGIILGGDCSKGNQKAISITAFGIQGKLELRRNACKPGDAILTTGIHGLSKLGFLIKNKINLDNDIPLKKRLISKSIEHFCRPKVYPNFLKNLIKTRTNNKIKRIGCTDSSDGLFQALQDLASASKCKAIINYEIMKKYPKIRIGQQEINGTNIIFLEAKITN